ncbi:hypothetical protein N431DRAFT_115338 [Stipitochalara longipes BDJ]|nr:hypothetical protein N431DRAFT_115338 [Stipitochalara longipes BDJ]
MTPFAPIISFRTNRRYQASKYLPATHLNSKLHIPPSPAEHMLKTLLHSTLQNEGSGKILPAPRLPPWLTCISQLLLTLALITLFTLISGLPTSIEAVNLLTKRSNLYCHSGLSTEVCEDQYGAYCDSSGEIYTPDYPEDGESCTSRYCFCSY